MRRALAIITSIITLFAIKEGFHIFSSTDKDIVNQRSILIVIALSIIIPLVLLSLWLWSPKRNNTKTNS
jgi:hypothetical protein